MTYDHIMVRFGELSTKGKNKNDFIKILAKNIAGALSDFEGLEIIRRFDHIYVKLNENDPLRVIEVLQDVSGIQGLSLVLKTEDDIENLKKVCLDLVQQEEGTTFKVNSKRANKNYPMISDKINREIATVILKNTDLKVDVHNPDIMVSIEIRDDGAYVFTHTYKGAGGYPLGVGGKIMHMLSGGIDSPVAAYLLMKRGIKIECIHFASPPYTNAGVIEKLKDLLGKLIKYQPEIRLNIIPFTKLQEEIYAQSDESYAITIMRRMMFRLADRLAKRRRCLAISTGESVGQVASQTLTSLSVINEVTTIPVIRPVVCYDKLEIIDLAKKINTYETSILPFIDCCTIFVPKHPVINPELNICEEYEKLIDVEGLIQRALESEEIIKIKSVKEREYSDLV